MGPGRLPVVVAGRPGWPTGEIPSTAARFFVRLVLSAEDTAHIGGVQSISLGC
jgi:hypothetical protein